MAFVCKLVRFIGGVRVGCGTSDKEMHGLGRICNNILAKLVSANTISLDFICDRR